MAERARRHQQGERAGSKRGTRAQAFADQRGRSVQAGPFTGMKYPAGDLSYVDALVPKLLGTYEQELHAVLRRSIDSEPGYFIDFGAAEGYYAVGFALKSVCTSVLAYDLAPSARAACLSLAKENGVADRVQPRVTAGFGELTAAQLPGSVLLSDVEGYEATLFDADAIRLLAHTTVVVETHEAVVPRVRDTLRDRFAPTHSIEIVETSYPRPPLEMKIADVFPPEDLADIMYEGRTAAEWMIFRPAV